MENGLSLAFFVILSSDILAWKRIFNFSHRIKWDFFSVIFFFLFLFWTWKKNFRFLLNVFFALFFLWHFFLNTVCGLVWQFQARATSGFRLLNEGNVRRVKMLFDCVKLIVLGCKMFRRSGSDKQTLPWTLPQGAFPTWWTLNGYFLYKSQRGEWKKQKKVRETSK